MSKTDYMEMRPNAQDRDVFFCERNYIEPRRQIVKTESGEEQKTFPPTFRMVNGAKKRYVPTEKLVDDEMFHFPEDESTIFKSFLLPSPKLEKAYAEEIRKRQIEVQGIQNVQPPVQPYQSQTATTPVRPMQQQPQMQAGPGLAPPHGGAQAPGSAQVRPGIQPQHRGFTPGQMQGPYGRVMPPHMQGGRPGMPGVRAPGPYNVSVLNEKRKVDDRNLEYGNLECRIEEKHQSAENQNIMGLAPLRLRNLTVSRSPPLNPIKLIENKLKNHEKIKTGEIKEKNRYESPENKYARMYKANRIYQSEFLRNQNHAFNGACCEIKSRRYQLHFLLIIHRISIQKSALLALVL